MDGRKGQAKSKVSTKDFIVSFRDGVAPGGPLLRQSRPVVWVMEPPRCVGHSIDLNLHQAKA